MKYTDINVPVKCAECDEVMEGKQQVIDHLLLVHGETYDQKEALHYAEIWVDNAYDERREEMKAYYEDLKINKAIDADAFPHK